MKKNIIANIIGRFWGILSNFIFIPLYIHYLGFESYSIISFTLVIAGMMAILDAGLTSTLAREFARTDNSDAEKLKTFKTLESAYFIIVSIVIITIFGFSGIIADKWLNLRSYTPQQVSLFLKIISFDIGFQLLFGFYMGGLLGLEKQIKANVFQVSWGIFRNGLVVLAIYFVPQLNMFFLWQAISTIIVTILIKLALEKQLSGRYNFYIALRIQKSIFNRVWQFAGGMMLIAVVASLNTQMDKIAISRMLSLESLGYYTLAISLSQGILVLINPIATALLPRFTALYSQGRSMEASKLYYQVSLVVSIIVFAVMANMSFFGRDLIYIWTGNVDLAEHIYKIIPIVSLAYAMLALQVMPYYIAIANGYTKLNNILGIISLCVTLPGYWILTHYYGAIGAGSVFLIVQLITTFIYLFYINKKFLDPKFIMVVYVKHIVLPLFISLVIAYLFSIMPDINNRIISFLWVGFSTIVTIIVSVCTLFPLQEIKNTFKQRSINQFNS